MECFVIAITLQLNPNDTLITSSRGWPVTEKVNKLPTSLLPKNEQQEKGGHNLCLSSYLYNNGLESEARVVKVNFLSLKKKAPVFGGGFLNVLGHFRFEGFPLTSKKKWCFYPAVFSRTDCHWKKNEWVVVVSFERMNCETTTIAIWRIQFAWSQISCVCLRWFFTFYHGKWLLNHHLENMFVIFSKHHEINTSEINEFKPDESWCFNRRKFSRKSPLKWDFVRQIFVCGDLPKNKTGIWWLVTCFICLVLIV